MLKALKLLKLLNLIFDIEPETLLKGIICFLLLPLALICVVFIAPFVLIEGVPAASPSQVQYYIDAAKQIHEKYDLNIDWQELLAIDAVRLDQDFCKSSNERALQLAEKYIWEEKITHHDTYTGPDGQKHSRSWTETIYHAYSKNEVLNNLNFTSKQKDKVKVFLETDLSVLQDVGCEMPEGWEPVIKDFLWPIPGVYRITSKYGPRIDPVEHLDGFHTGLDIGANKGTNVIAMEKGKVVKAGFCGNYGKLIEIHHDNGYVTRYAHLSKVLVKINDEVKKGDSIGKVGSTGKSTGPHLHFEIRYLGKTKNPLLFFTEGNFK